MQIADILRVAHSDPVEALQEGWRRTEAVKINEDMIDLGLDRRQDLLEGFEAAGHCGDRRHPRKAGEGGA